MKSTNSNHFRLQESPSFFISTTTHNSLYNTTLHTSCCIYSNKDKNFKANHNKKADDDQPEWVVSIVTKIRILKQITTPLYQDGFCRCCIYSNKDKNFKANHNLKLVSDNLVRVVSIVTKIRILKQITTLALNFFNLLCCIYSNKDKNFKANHNISVECLINLLVVSIVTKIRILKQITTLFHACAMVNKLYL